MENSEGPKQDAAKLIPWRDKVKGLALKLSLVKMVIVKGGTNDVHAHWMKYEVQQV